MCPVGLHSIQPIAGLAAARGVLKTNARRQQKGHPLHVHHTPSVRNGADPAISSTSYNRPRTLPLWRPSKHIMATKTSTPGWAWAWIERLWQDIRYGCRILAANPGFTLVAVISLAMGVGANAAAFSWADALLLRPLAVARPGDIVTVGSTMSVEGFSRLGAS